MDYDEWNGASDAKRFAAYFGLLSAMEALFDHCAMVHRHWGENSNQAQADAAIESARAAIRKAKGE